MCSDQYCVGYRVSARMKGEEPTPAKPQSRRDMLPEIDEINTTLRASTERSGLFPAPPVLIPGIDQSRSNPCLMRHFIPDPLSKPC